MFPLVLIDGYSRRKLLVIIFFNSLSQLLDALDQGVPHGNSLAPGLSETVDPFVFT